MDSSGGSDDARLADALKKARPKVIVAILEDDRERVLHTPLTRGRWERYVQLARACGAVRVEGRDDEGAVVVSVELDEDATESSSTPSSTRTPRSEVAELVSIALAAQDRAVARQAEMMRAVLDGALGVMRASAERATSLERAVLSLVEQRQAELAAVATQLEATAAEQAAAAPSDASRMADEAMAALVPEVIGALRSKGGAS